MKTIPLYMKAQMLMQEQAGVASKPDVRPHRCISAYGAHLKLRTVSGVMCHQVY